MTASKTAETSSKKGAACPRCDRNDDVSNYARLAYNDGADADDTAALYADAATARTRVACTAADGYIGSRTRFCFFRVENDSTLFVCEKRH